MAAVPVACLGFVALGPIPRAGAATSVTITITNGTPSPNPAQVESNGTVTWRSTDRSYTIHVVGDATPTTISPGNPASVSGLTETLQYRIGAQPTGFTVNVVDTSASSTSQEPQTIPPTSALNTTSTTTAPSTTDTTSTTTGPSTTDTTSTTTTSTTEPSTTTTEVSSESALVPIGDSADGGGPSAWPWLAGSSVLVAGLAGLVYYLWWRSGGVPTELAEPPEAPAS